MLMLDRPGLLAVLHLIATGRRCYYRTLGLTARVALGLLERLRIPAPQLSRLSIGDLQRATGARDRAFARAEALLPAGLAPFGASVGRIFGIDFSLLVEKHLYDELYDRLLFVELAYLLAAEQPSERHVLVVNDRTGRALGRPPMAANLRVWVMPSFDALNFFLSLVGLLPLLCYHRPRKPVAGIASSRGGTVCLVSDPTTLQMFRCLMGGRDDVRYAIEPAYTDAIPARERELSDVAVLALGTDGFRQLRRGLLPFIMAAVRSAPQLASWGTLPFEMFHLLAQGRGLAGELRDSTVLTFEHLTLARSVRNEFLRAKGCTSVFVPKNSYVTYRHYPAERRVNYDLVCASGPHAEQLYRWKRAVTQRFAVTGSYDAHAEEPEGAAERRRNLEQLKNGRLLITVLSPGLCVETTSHEQRLMQLAARIAARNDVCVVVRLKPGTRNSANEQFYRNYLDASPVTVTAEEFDLFDFVGPTDLFLTSISTSSCDVALRGATVVFVDFMHTPELYLPWLEVPAVVLAEEGAYDWVRAWLHDAPNGPMRTAHSRAVARLVAYIGHDNGSFDAYRGALLDVLTAASPRIRDMGPTPEVQTTALQAETVFKGD